MHRQLTGFSLTDHKNGNGLDNRRENLRQATPAQNSRNQHGKRKPRSPNGSTRYVGVHWRVDKRKWQAMLVGASDGKRHLGYFNDEAAAARAYDKAAHERDPEFCNLNFPEEYEQ
ncbi:HNH endonuclease [Streptomyces sp. NPDC058471]|uniref:HNH endonuclease n=1 Tax=Streptomyces sp. NPDC058471 TaxID=3346516 RepID=UPI00364F5C79